MTSTGRGVGRAAGGSRALRAGGAAAASAAALIWLLVALHHTRAHGTTEVNEMRLVLGLTWMDTAKVLPGARRRG